MCQVLGMQRWTRRQDPDFTGSYLKTMAGDVRGGGELPGCLLSLVFGTSSLQHLESSRFILALGGTQ